MKYTFKTGQSDELIYDPLKIITVFYQICIFKDPKTNKYNIRKLYFDEHKDIIKIKNIETNNKILNKFIKENPCNIYKTYSTYNMQLIDLPNASERHASCSDLLKNNKCNNSRYALF
jgi:hypothetical protein